MQKTNVMRLLEAAEIAYTAYEYDISDGDVSGKSVAAKIGLPEGQVFKTLVTESSAQENYVFVIPVSDELNLKKAAKAAGVKSIDLIPAKKLLPLTGYIHGGCSPVGMKKSLPTFIDESAILYDFITVSGGKIGSNLGVAPEDLAGLLNAGFYDLH